MNNSIVFYNKNTGYAVTGTLRDGRWEPDGPSGSVESLPPGYTNGAASRDSLVLYNRETGAGETGTFTGGEYNRTEAFQGAAGWSHVVATRDSVLFYNKDNGGGASGTLQNGVYREKRGYDDFSTGWQSVAASFDTVVFTRQAGAAGFPETDVAWGVLHNGEYTHSAQRTDPEGVVRLTATSDTALEVRVNGATSYYHAALATGGLLDHFREAGTDGVWNLVGSTADSVFFYQADGTCRAAKLSQSGFTNSAPVADVLPAIPGWTLIEGGV
jgi:hypothetical protein